MAQDLNRLMIGSAIGVWDAPVSQRVFVREAADVLAQVPLFAGLSRRQLEKVAGVALHKHYLAGANLVRVGTPGDAFYVILGGEVSVDVPANPVTLGAGEFFGEMAMIDGEPRFATVTAVTDAVLLVIPRQKFLALLVSEPKVTIAILATLAQRLRKAQA